MYKAAFVLVLVALTNAQTSSAESTTSNGETTNAQTSSPDETTTSYEEDDGYEEYYAMVDRLQNDEFDGFVKIINDCRSLGYPKWDDDTALWDISPDAYDDDEAMYSLDKRTALCEDKPGCSMQKMPMPQYTALVKSVGFQADDDITLDEAKRNGADTLEEYHEESEAEFNRGVARGGFTLCLPDDFETQMKGNGGCMPRLSLKNLDGLSCLVPLNSPPLFFLILFLFQFCFERPTRVWVLFPSDVACFFVRCLSLQLTEINLAPIACHELCWLQDTRMTRH
jgi:hypothetical protein